MYKLIVLNISTFLSIVIYTYVIYLVRGFRSRSNSPVRRKDKGKSRKRSGSPRVRSLTQQDKDRGSCRPSKQGSHKRSSKSVNFCIERLINVVCRQCDLWVLHIEVVVKVVVVLSNLNSIMFSCISRHD